jgi:hypothetical protein
MGIDDVHTASYILSMNTTLKTDTASKMEITKVSEKTYGAAEAKLLLNAHPMVAGARGSVGTLNHGWQVWKLLDGGRLVVTVYIVRGSAFSETCRALARVAFPEGGKLRRRAGYTETFDIL